MLYISNSIDYGDSSESEIDNPRLPPFIPLRGMKEKFWIFEQPLFNITRQIRPGYKANRRKSSIKEKSDLLMIDRGTYPKFQARNLK
ncbi:hypothetical protein PS704_00176 [Pseudomonas fluorescens]|jgi:hypothetical protein|uniref:Uncharacterized protein n=1 Tax=Pseudomonas fluorescens TaxID=294 RepID=A0A5E6ZLL9_PSEFL|nr:hypothetical protein PS704_00176 [Pseudomonas fluorescens]